MDEFETVSCFTAPWGFADAILDVIEKVFDTEMVSEGEIADAAYADMAAKNEWRRKDHDEGHRQAAGAFDDEADVPF